MTKILDGKATAKELREELKEKVGELREREIPVRLDVILASEDPASATYVAMKQRDCEEVGIESRVHRFDDSVTQEELSRLVDELNESGAVSGFFMQLPLFPHLDHVPLIEKIRPEKDVDGLSPTSIGNLAIGSPALLPCTPHGVIQILKRASIEIAGKHAVVIGRSNLVGKPLAQLLLRENATVTVCHSKTKKLSEITRQADLLCVAAGRPHMVGAEYVKEGAVVVDVGIHRTDDGTLTGDVLYDEVAEKASHITPVPGGVGPMTRAMLLYNTVEAAGMREG